jgi:dCMP deaminase
MIYRYTDPLLYKPIDRPDWTDYFIGLCFFVAERSEDAETHHGCIITDQKHHIIGVGYNSFPSGTTPGLMPNTRAGNKYPYMIHAEENALAHCTVNTHLIPEGAISYCTGKSCLKCLYRLWNNNIRTLYCADVGYHFADYEKEQQDFDDFVADTGIKIHTVVPNLAWLKPPINKLSQHIGG